MADRTDYFSALQKSAQKKAELKKADLMRLCAELESLGINKAFFVNVLIFAAFCVVCHFWFVPWFAAFIDVFLSLSIDDADTSRVLSRVIAWCALVAGALKGMRGGTPTPGKKSRSILVPVAVAALISFCIGRNKE